jgi:hypothetical protein
MKSQSENILQGLRPARKIFALDQSNVTCIPSPAVKNSARASLENPPSARPQIVPGGGSSLGGERGSSAGPALFPPRVSRLLSMRKPRGLFSTTGGGLRTPARSRPQLGARVRCKLSFYLDFAGRPVSSVFA